MAEGLKSEILQAGSKKQAAATDPAVPSPQGCQGAGDHIHRVPLGRVGPPTPDPRAEAGLFVWKAVERSWW